MNPPAWFVKELHEFDSDLRLRWSVRLELWQIERKVRRSLHPGTIKNDGYHDDYIRAQDGYLLVASVPPHGLGRRVFEVLKASDLWSNGGWAKVADKLEAFEEQEEKARDKSFSDDIQAMSKELYDWLAVRDGRQIFNTGWVQ